MGPYMVFMLVLLGATHVASPVGPEIELAHRVMMHWNKPIVVLGSARAPILHPTSRYAFTASPVPRPNIHPRGEIVHELSFLVVNAHMTPKLNKRIIACGANATATRTAQWGLYNAEQFASDRVQVEYYVSVKRSTEKKWVSDIEKYVRSGGMTTCVTEGMEGFKGNVVYAKKATVSLAVKMGILGEQAWVIWVIVALATVVVVEVLVVVCLRERRKRILARRQALRGSSSEEGRSIVGYDAVRVGNRMGP